MRDLGVNTRPVLEHLSVLDRLSQSKLVVAIVSLLTTAALTVVKLSLGMVTGSLALMADGLQGLMDVIITFSTVLFVVGAAQPACATWTNGREKLEALAALVESAVLSVIAVCIWYLAAEKLVFGHHVAEIERWHLVVFIMAIAADWLRARYVGRVAKATNSMALEANAAHFRTDALGSIMVLGGLILAYQGWPMADTIATLALATFLTWTSWRIGRRAAGLLLDINDPAVSLAALETLEGHPSVAAVPMLRLHRRLQGCDIVARVVLHPDQAIGGVQLAEALEAQLLARTEALSATVAVELEPARA